jgi:hypothetical protein
MKIIITENQYNRVQIITEGKNIKEFIQNLRSFDDVFLNKVKEILVKSNFSMEGLKSMFPNILTPEVINILNNISVSEFFRYIKAFYNVLVKNKYNLSEQDNTEDIEKVIVDAIKVYKSKKTLDKNELKTNLRVYHKSSGGSGQIAVSLFLGLIGGIGVAAALSAGVGVGAIVAVLTALAVYVVWWLIQWGGDLIRYFKTNADIRKNLASLETQLSAVQSQSSLANTSKTPK